MSHDTFEIPIIWKDAEISFRARFIPAGYITRIGVDVYGQELLLDPDEEGQYRVLMNADEAGNYPGIDLQLVKEIVDVLNTIHGVD